MAGTGGQNRRRRTVGGAILGAVAILVACAVWNGAVAQEWKLSTNISQRMLYSDNLLLNRDNEIETFGSITTPELRLERTSPTTSILFDGRFEFAEYLDHSNFNSQDQFLTLGVEHHLSERSMLNLSGNFTRDTTLKSEQDATNKFLDDSFRFTQWQVAPSWSYLLSPIDEVSLRGSYRQVSYDTDEKTDFQYFGSAIAYNRKLDELSQVTGSVSAFRFIPDEPGESRTDTLSALMGYAYTPSERFSISGSVGLAYAMREEDGTESDDNGSDLGYRFRLDMKYLMDDQAAARLSLSHDSEPSGDGDQVTRNRIGASLNYKVTGQTSLGLNVDYADSADILGFEGSSTSDEEKSRYASVRPSVAWQLTEDVSLVAEYRYRHKVFEDSGDAASSNSVFLTLQYEFPTLIGEGF